MAGFVVLDANVLYGIEVTDLFATMAKRSVLPTALVTADPRRGRAQPRQAARPSSLRRSIGASAHLNQALPGALSEVPDSLIDAMPVNENKKALVRRSGLRRSAGRQRGPSPVR